MLIISFLTSSAPLKVTGNILQYPGLKQHCLILFVLAVPETPFILHLLVRFDVTGVSETADLKINFRIFFSRV
jgi:hypothetical protein